MNFVESNLPPTKFLLFRFDQAQECWGWDKTYYESAGEERYLSPSTVLFIDLKSALEYTKSFIDSKLKRDDGMCASYDFYELIELSTQTRIMWGDSECNYKFGDTDPL